MCLCSLSGGELFDRIADDNYKMTESEVIKYIRQVCDALRYMHELYIVHLDIKVCLVILMQCTDCRLRIIAWYLIISVCIVVEMTDNLCPLVLMSYQICLSLIYLLYASLL